MSVGASLNINSNIGARFVALHVSSLFNILPYSLDLHSAVDHDLKVYT